MKGVRKNQFRAAFTSYAINNIIEACSQVNVAFADFRKTFDRIIHSSSGVTPGRHLGQLLFNSSNDRVNNYIFQD